MLDRIIVGAYACSPSRERWLPGEEDRFLSGVADIPGFGGLELPWNGRLHPWDSDWLVRQLDPSWDLVLTTIPAWNSAEWAAARIGLGSTDEPARREAVIRMTAVADNVELLNQRAGRQSVIAVEIHSAPRAPNASVEAFARSLSELAELDWQGATLTVEHCDAFSDEHDPEKGYLTVQQEIDAIETSGAPATIALNWGRSAIERRSAQGVIEHSAVAAQAGILSALIFSGASSVETDFGCAWSDVHLPFTSTPGFDGGEPESLLTPAAAAESLAAAIGVSWIGLKMTSRPRDLPVEQIVKRLAENVGLLRSLS